MKRQCAKLRQVLPSGAGRRLAGHAPGAVHPWSTVFGAPVTGAVADTRLVGELEQKHPPGPFLGGFSGIQIF